MRCDTAKKLLPLKAGGGLPARDEQALVRHLEICPDCAAELEKLQRATALIDDAAGSAEQTLPPGFVDAVEARIDSEPEPKMRLSGRPAVLRFALAACLILAVAAALYPRLMRPVTPARIVDAAGILNPGDLSVFAWSEIEPLARYFHEPVPYEQWQPDEGTPGVYLILHKPDPENSPGLYSVDYIGQGKSYKLRGFPWFMQYAWKLLERAKSPENVFVAVCYLPGAGLMDRRIAERALDRVFDPFLND